MKRLLLALLFANLAVGSSFAFNPQPEPPGNVALNPQPEPPGITAKVLIKKQLRAVNRVMLNPQPLPP